MWERECNIQVVDEKSLTGCWKSPPAAFPAFAEALRAGRSHRSEAQRNEPGRGKTLSARMWSKRAGQAKLGMYLLACGLARGTGRLGAPGWVGKNRGLFEHPVVIV